MGVEGGWGLNETSEEKLFEFQDLNAVLSDVENTAI